MRQTAVKRVIQEENFQNVHTKEYLNEPETESFSSGMLTIPHQRQLRGKGLLPYYKASPKSAVVYARRDIIDYMNKQCKVSTQQMDILAELGREQEDKQTKMLRGIFAEKLDNLVQELVEERFNEELPQRLAEIASKSDETQ